MVEAIAEVDDILMEMFVESVDEGCNFTPAVLIPALWRACIKGYIAPTLCRASLRNPSHCASYRYRRGRI